MSGRDEAYNEYRRKHKVSTEYYRRAIKGNSVRLKKHNALSKKWRESNPEERRLIKKKSDLKRMYGMTLDEVNKVQLCQLCNKPFLGAKREPYSRVVDHAKRPGRAGVSVRGVIHRKCNSALGFFDDNVEMLESAIQYLRRYNGK